MEDYSDLKRKDLQKIAKENGIKGNKSNEDIIKELQNLKSSKSPRKSPSKSPRKSPSKSPRKSTSPKLSHGKESEDFYYRGNELVNIYRQNKIKFGDENDFKGVLMAIKLLKSVKYLPCPWFNYDWEYIEDENIGGSVYHDTESDKIYKIVIYTNRFLLKNSIEDHIDQYFTPIFAEKIRTIGNSDGFVKADYFKACSTIGDNPKVENEIIEVYDYIDGISFSDFVLGSGVRLKDDQSLLIKPGTIQYKRVTSLFLQILCLIWSLVEAKISHFDLHSGNILIVKTEEKRREYNAFGITYYVKTYGYSPIIIDYDRVGGVYGNDVILSNYIVFPHDKTKIYNIEDVINHPLYFIIAPFVRLIDNIENDLKDTFISSMYGDYFDFDKIIHYLNIYQGKNKRTSKNYEVFVHNYSKLGHDQYDYVLQALSQPLNELMDYLYDLLD
jgi:hypothetical protein